MPLTNEQVVQIENRADSINDRAVAVNGAVNAYTVQLTPSLSYGRQLEQEATDTLRQANTFLNDTDVRDGTLDNTYGPRVVASVDKTRESKVLAQGALDNVRNRLQLIGTTPDTDVDEDGQPITEGAAGTENSIGPLIGGVSIGQVVEQSKNARDPNSGVFNPPLDTQYNSVVPEVDSNADDFVFRNDGVFENVVNLDLYNDDAGQAGSPSTGAGDPTGGGGSGTNVTVPSAFTSAIQTRGNPLSNMSTYTYQISLYIMTPQQAIDMSRGEVKSTTGLKLMIQSGGISAGGGWGDEMRDYHFDLDYYIENLEIESLLPRANRGITNATRITFDIIEPYGFTFIQRLKEAAKSYFGTNDFVKQHYLMVIRFNGYDEEGQQITSQSGQFAEGAFDNNRSNSNSLVEKFIPFKFTQITTRAATGAVTYHCEALPINHFEALSQKRATVPFQLEIKGKFIKDAFKELEDALNERQKILSGQATPKGGKEERRNAQAVPDEYKFTIDPRIGDILLKPPGTTASQKTPSPDPTVGTHLLGDRNQVKKDEFIVTVQAGQQLQQTVDQILSASQYITGQQRRIWDVNQNKWVAQSSNKVLAWYKVTTKTEPTDYDKTRRDYGYKIEYVITPQQVTDTKVPNFPKDQFRGVHKKYNYWFTGENTEVLDYEVEFNALYYTSLNPKFDNDSAEYARELELDSREDFAPATPGPANESEQNGVGEHASDAARAKAVLYSPTDFAQLEMTVLGDPDLIQQGDIFYKAGNTFEAWLPDGSVNYDSQEVFVEVFFNTIEDYNMETGEAEVKDVQLKSADQWANTGTKGIIYQLIQVKNIFKEGNFRQELVGLMKEFPERGTVDVKPVTIEKQNISVKPPEQFNIDLNAGTGTQSGTTATVTPTLGGLTLTGGSFRAPPDA